MSRVWTPHGGMRTPSFDGMAEELDTVTRMEGMEKRTPQLLALVCCLLAFQVWIPILVPMAVGNVDEERCEDSMLATWLKVNIIVAYFLPAVIMLAILVSAKAKVRCIFKSGRQLHVLAQVAVIAICIWGWSIAASTTAKNCMKDPDRINPHAVMQVVLVWQTVLFPLLMCCLCLACCVLLACRGPASGAGPPPDEVGNARA